MRVPLSWLAEFVEDLPPVEEIGRRLTMSGLEVEAIERAEPPEVGTLVVARIDACGPHPNADRLRLCEVFDGHERRSIVCGASNMTAGDFVVLAKPGARLADGRKIKKSKIRGCASDGMLCSASELGTLGSEEGILILREVVEPGADAAPLLGLGECVLEVAVTPNRGDCLSLLGLAREVAAVCRLPLTDAFERASQGRGAAGSRPDRAAETGVVPVSLEADSGCPAYRGLLVEGVRIGPSPQWMQARLAACGLRPINNVVDVTNYVLFELGQPLHAFDADKLAGPSIRVRAARDGESMRTLDGETRHLLGGDILICDAAGAVALGGVMGGEGSAVETSTTSVFLEAAVFEPSRIRATSRRLGLISESSYRFERGVDPGRVVAALYRAADLLGQSGAAIPRGGLSQAGELPAAAPEVELRLARVERVLGTVVSREEASSALERLGAGVRADGERLRCTPPSHRHDLTAEIDLIEEVARMVGYERVPDCLPLVKMHEAEVPPVHRVLARVRAELVALGMSEAVGLSFCSSQMNRTCPGLHPPKSTAVEVKNPLREDAGEMRRSLLPVLLHALALNTRNGARSLDLYTVGRTMAVEDGVFHELDVIAGMVSGPRRKRAPGLDGPATFLDLKAAVERIAAQVAEPTSLVWAPVQGRPEYHPSSACEIRLAEACLGVAGQIHPALAESLEVAEESYLFEIDSRKLVDYAAPHSGLRPIGRFPGSVRDVSFEAPVGLLAGEIIAAIDELDERLVETVSVFDDYRSEQLGAERKALGISVTYRSNEKTLTDAEVSEVHERVLAHVTDRLGVSVRA